ncbi:MAG TPA: DUF2889 domain-containing protein [Rhodospirillaceae bacterium]|nr:DUF2889 domain-containing protein [Rhodospirillaceae bacterium]
MTQHPPAAGRSLIHERQVVCRGYRRDDGLWDIEGHLTDVKTYDFMKADGGVLLAGQPVHEMTVRVTIDNHFLIHAVEVSMQHQPTSYCDTILPNFASLVGLTLGPGFRQEVRKRVGGVRGCTHIVEMLGPIATAAFQTIAPILDHYDYKPPADDGPPGKPLIIDSCHVLAADGPVVAMKWPEFATKPKG